MSVRYSAVNHSPDEVRRTLLAWQMLPADHVHLCRMKVCFMPDDYTDDAGHTAASGQNRRIFAREGR